MAKAGRKSWTTKAPPQVLRLVEERLASGHAATTIHADLNLTRFVSRSTFRHWAAARRRDLERRRLAGGDARPTSGDARPTQDTADTAVAPGAAKSVGLLEQVLDAMGEALAGGRVKVYELTAAVKALVALQKLDIDQAAEARAAEVHELQVRDLRQAVDAATNDGEKTLTREAVFDLVDQVMRGAA